MLSFLRLSKIGIGCHNIATTLLILSQITGEEILSRRVQVLQILLVIQKEAETRIISL